MKLPNGERVDLGTKLVDYTLNPYHRRGQHKARVFESALGIILANRSVLEQALRDAATTSDAAEFRGDNGFGRTYVLRFRLTTARGTATVLSAWIGGRMKTFLG